ncbi:SpoIIE family protein phosphatase/ATP-binding protein [Yinghuangia aomiensis]|uniref:SpoIIE family protein phosphatase/ATP-binding protein n=1 Tax=Yinghuangia aomiensis TaxID=676205 RepID=A0ABP9H5B5_9ACTN
MRSRVHGPRTLAGQIFVLQVVVVVLLVAAAVVVLLVQARGDSERDAQHRSQTAAQTYAHSPGLVAALSGRDPAAVLGPSAQAAQQAADVDALTVLDVNGVRLTGPDPAQIGMRYQGNLGPFLAAGQSLTTKYTTHEGQAYVTVVPVYGRAGEPLGVVVAAIAVARVNETVGRQIPWLALGAAGALALSAGATALISRRLRRQTRGLGPSGITRMYEHHDAVLHAAREGVLILDADRRVVLANDEARRLLDLPPETDTAADADVVRGGAAALGLPAGLTELLVSGRDASDEVHVVGDRLLAVNQRPTAPYGSAGSVVTLRDTTELRALAGQAQAVRERLRLLYEAGVRVGTTLDVERTTQELANLCVPRFADIITVDLLDTMLDVDEPPAPTTAPGRMRRVTSHWADWGGGVPALYPIGEVIDFAPTTPMAEALREGRGVLRADLDTDGAWQAQAPDRTARLIEAGVHSLVTVPLRARGLVLGLATFWRGAGSPAFDADDVSFAEEVAARAAVAVDNARRYTREHTTAVTLQRSLLPQALPGQDAVDAAFRYLPARAATTADAGGGEPDDAAVVGATAAAGVGGDWFDVIVLPGARVALVVGDVVGHGLHAAATMGQLRTAVRNFSALDLPPDEVLGHLDELVAGIDQDLDADGPGTEDVRMTGATCLYVVYDPVAGRAVAARAGHPGPMVVDPAGAVDYPDVPVSLPLGLNEGLPIETAAFDLAEGSRLVLFTDGLVERRDRDVDAGLRLLRDALVAAGPAATPEETCDAVIAALVAEGPRDDVALLVARTQVLENAQVASWDVPSDPEAVGVLRAACASQLDAWGLGGIDFTAELILSELVTNAIRYGTAPIRVRLIHERALTCEVSDASSTAPHLRRAATTDEGGRGLFLVARFAARWGTRYTARGKVIWAELPLADTGDAPKADLGEALLDQFDDTGW